MTQKRYNEIPKRQKCVNKEEPYIGGAVDIIDDAKGKTQQQINKEADDTFAFHQSEINALNSQNYVTVDSFSSLPTTGAVDTVYRVSNWDGTQQDPSVYSEYAWNGEDYVHLSTKTQIGEVFDISAYHATGGTLTTYVDLAAALDGGNNIPQELRKGGMSIKFVQSSDNKYVQCRLMADEFTTDVNKWQGIDEKPTVNKNLIESWGVREAINNIIADTIEKEISVTGTTTTTTGIALETGKKYAIYAQCGTAADSAGIYVLNASSQLTKIATLSAAQWDEGYIMEYTPVEDVVLYVRPYATGTVSVKVWIETIPITLEDINSKVSQNAYLLSEAYSENGNVTYDAHGAISTYPVKWTDGTTGTYTATDWDESNQMYKGYQVTYSSTHKVVQAAVTVANYKVTNVPAKQVVEL